MGFEHAINAYRQSAYREIELKNERSVRAAGNPVWGGIGSSIKRSFNQIARPFKVGKALLFGGEYPVEELKQAQTPEDVKNTHYGAALDKQRDFARQAVDQKAEGVGKLLSFDLGGYFRNKRAARYAEDQTRRVILPDEKPSMIGSAALLAASVGARLGTRRLIDSLPSAPSYELGALSAPALPSVADAAAGVASAFSVA